MENLVKLSGLQRMNLSKESLTAKENKSKIDFVRLANVTDKLENKTASAVYKNCKASPYLKDILGKSKVPTFADFVAKLRVKPCYSSYDGYLTFAKFNLAEVVRAKVVRQNKSEAKK